eukprot:3931240-Rhodomonas_salina.1
MQSRLIRSPSHYRRILAQPVCFPFWSSRNWVISRFERAGNRERTSESAWEQLERPHVNCDQSPGGNLN